MRLASTGIRDYKEYPVLLNLFNFFFGIFSTISRNFRQVDIVTLTTYKSRKL